MAVTRLFTYFHLSHWISSSARVHIKVEARSEKKGESAAYLPCTNFLRTIRHGRLAADHVVSRLAAWSALLGRTDFA